MVGFGKSERRVGRAAAGEGRASRELNASKRRSDLAGLDVALVGSETLPLEMRLNVSFGFRTWIRSNFL